MGKSASRTWTRSFSAPAEAVWALLADTARYNEAAGLPRHEIIEEPGKDGAVAYYGRTRVGPFELFWREEPVNWVSGHWFEHSRYFQRGPLKTLTARFEIEPAEGGSHGRYTITASPKGLIGRLMLATGFFKGAGGAFLEQAAAAERHLLGESEEAYAYTPPPLSKEAKARLAALLPKIENSGHGHGLAEKLAAHLGKAQEIDLTRIQPLRLARLWQVPAIQTIELCLEATRQGLLTLRWDLLCPRCRVAKSSVEGLDNLPKGAHCGTCNIDYDRDFAKNVELTFQPAPAVRAVGIGEYCLFGPMSTPHILMHITVQPGESRVIEADLKAGAYRLRTLQPGPELDLEYECGGFPAVFAKGSEIRAGAAAEAGKVRFENHTARPLTFVVEQRAWVKDALTADRVTALQAFRDLFSDQVLRPGDEVAVGHVALMFTDLKGSTALYGRIGDASAYHLVRDHFAFLARVVREHEGAIVKTIGDAIMAAFVEPGQALAAALEIQRRVAAFNEAHGGAPITIKMGLHVGPCIAVTLNDRLDYFGSTVNKAARLQGASRGGDIVLSRETKESLPGGKLPEDLDAVEERANLKGFDEEVDFFRIAMAAS